MFWHRSFDVALGLSALSWAVLGLLRAPDRPLAIRIALAGLNLTVAGLFLFRRSARANPSPGALFAALPSMVFASAAVKLTAEWSATAQVLFCLAALGAVTCLLTLGRSFAFFPSRRELVVGGPYRLLRHPAYACELAMVGACVVAAPWPNGLLALLVAATLVLRIRAEERILDEDEGYAAYRAKVRWRLVPLVY